jgi:hypothetical protein
VSAEAFLRATNLLDHTIRCSTSNLKGIAPLGWAALLAAVCAAF